ncbi:hypothetical protein GC169_13605 [bacterium]|nr:hypothetical protein [bacterium]
MKSILTATAVILSLSLSACGDEGRSAETRTAVVSAADRKAAEAEAAAAEREAARQAEIAALTASFATPEAFIAACTAQDLEAKICECAAKVTVDALGVPGLNPWVYEAYVLGDRMAFNRSNKFFTDNAIPEASVTKFKDEIDDCYVR